MKITDIEFPSEYPLIFLRGRRKFRVAEDLWVRYKVNGVQRHVVVPYGQYTNGPSWPTLLQGLFPILNDSLIAAIYHDHLASTPTSGVPRAEADALSREMKLAGDVTWLRAWAEWVAVRCVGWIKWHGAKG